MFCGGFWGDGSSIKKLEFCELAPKSRFLYTINKFVGEKVCCAVGFTWEGFASLRNP